MEGAFSWIGAIAERLGSLFPRLYIMDSTHGAVKFVSFRLRWWMEYPEIVKLPPGAHIWWPAASVFMVHPIARQANDLRAQTIVTKDGKTVTVGGMIVFEISDVEKILAHTYDPDDTIRDVALSCVHDVCIQYTLDELLEASRKGTLDTAMRREARKQLDTYGVDVSKVALTDLAPCWVLRTVGGNGGLEGILKG